MQTYHLIKIKSGPDFPALSLLEFSMFEQDFFIHAMDGERGEPDYCCSHVGTGLQLCSGSKSIAKAHAKACLTLKSVGREGLDRAINLASSKFGVQL